MHVEWRPLQTALASFHILAFPTYSPPPPNTLCSLLSAWTLPSRHVAVKAVRVMKCLDMLPVLLCV